MAKFEWGSFLVYGYSGFHSIFTIKLLTLPKLPKLPKCKLTHRKVNSNKSTPQHKMVTKLVEAFSLKGLSKFLPT